MFEREAKVIGVEGAAERHQHEAPGGEQGRAQIALDIVWYAKCLDQMLQGISFGLNFQVIRYGPKIDHHEHAHCDTEDGDHPKRCMPVKRVGEHEADR